MGSIIMKRDYNGKAISNIVNGNFYNLEVYNNFVISNSVRPTSITLTASPTSSYNLVFPTTQGGSGQVLANDGSGNLSWSTTTVGTVISVGVSAPTYFGASIAGTPSINPTVTFSPVTTGTGDLVLSTSPTFTGTVVAANIDILGAVNPINMLYSSIPNGGTMIYTLGKSKSTRNTGYMEFIHVSDASTSNRVDIGLWGIGALRVYPSTTYTLPATGVIASKISASESVIVNNGSFETTITTTASTSYNFILPTTAGSSGQLLTSGGGGTLTWSSGVGTVTSVGVSAPTYFGASIAGTPSINPTVTFSPVTTGTGDLVLSDSPTFTGTIANSGTSSEPLQLLNASLSANSRLVTLGKAKSTHNTGYIEFTHVSDGSVSNHIDVGLWSGGTIRVYPSTTYALPSSGTLACNDIATKTLVSTSGNAMIELSGATDPCMTFSYTGSGVKTYVGVASGTNSLTNGTVVNDYAIVTAGKKIVLSNAPSSTAGFILDTSNHVSMYEISVITNGTNPRLQTLVGSDELLAGTCSQVNAFFNGTAIGDSAIRSSKNLWLGTNDPNNYDIYMNGTLFRFGQGTWTPTFKYISSSGLSDPYLLAYDFQYGYYSRCGAMVNLYFDVGFSFTSNGDDVRFAAIGNLPVKIGVYATSGDIQSTAAITTGEYPNGMAGLVPAIAVPVFSGGEMMNAYEEGFPVALYENYLANISYGDWIADGFHLTISSECSVFTAAATVPPWSCVSTTRTPLSNLHGRSAIPTYFAGCRFSGTISYMSDQ